MSKIKKTLSVVLTAALTLTAAIPAFAKTTDATIDSNAPCSLEMFKYDITEASKAGIWNENKSYVASGYEDDNMTTIKDYAIEGVEYTIVPVANILQYTDTNTVALVYGFDKDDEILDIIGLGDGTERYKKADSLKDGKWYFESNVLNKALADKISKDEINTKNLIEAEASASTDKKVMPLTDENGRTKVENLKTGLYMVVETKVPENVVDSTNPFFVSLPMTDPQGDNWNYDVVAYPKNETGDPTLEKEVREAVKYTGKTEDFTKYATGSVGDLMEYQITSTLPKITSNAVHLTQYDFVDVIKGLSYKQDYPVKVDIYEDAQMTKKVTSWDLASGKFEVNYSGNVMTITMTETGLSEINSNYSEHTMVITYGANITNEVVLGEKGNPNEVTLTWERTSEGYYDTLKDEAKVYSFGIDITKLFSDVDSETATKDNLFDDVEFIVFNESDKVYINATLNPKGEYDVIGFTKNKDRATVFKPQKVGSEYGQITINGLEDDSYVLTEKSTAEGYTLLKDTIAVVVDFSDDKKATATINDHKVEMLADGASLNAYAALTVMNHKGFELPPTGDSSLWRVMLVTFVFTGAALIVITYIKRRNSN